MRRFKIINDLNHSEYGLYDENGKYIRMISREAIKFWFGKECAAKLAAEIVRTDKDEYWLTLPDGDLEVS